MTSLTVLFALCGGMAAQQVAVADVEALPGETVSLTLQLDIDGGSYTGLEFDILFPQTGFSTTGKATTTASWDGAFTIGDVDGVGISHLARCGVLSYSDTPIPDGGLQELGTVEFTPSDVIPTGSYTITLTNMTLIGDARVPVPDATFTLRVVNVHTVMLDETSTTAPVAATGVNVRVKRTIKAGEWNTICQPFAMSEAQVKEAFGEDVQLADFTGCETEEDEDERIVGISVKFESVTAIEANHPYLIKVSSAISEFTADGVDIDPEEEPSVDKDEYTIGSGKKAVTYYNRFVGTYVADTPLEAMTLFLSGNKFYYSAGKTKMKGYRAYFDFYDVLTDVEDTYSARIRFSVDSDVTGIADIEKDPILGGVYTLQGVSLGQKDVQSLPKGIYIVDGKKVSGK